LSALAAATRAFDEALDDDLNTAEALAAVFEYIRDTNTAMDAGEFLSGQRTGSVRIFDPLRFRVRRTETFLQRRWIIGCRCEAKIAERNAAKKAKDFARADQVRKDLAAQGIILEDTKEGVRWKRS